MNETAELGLDPQRARGIYLAALVHDIGKIAVPAELLSRPGTLSSLEFQLIQVQVGFDILKGIDFPWPVADVVEAMGSHRPYRQARTVETALAEIAAGRGVLYDPTAVDACLRLFREKGFTFSAEIASPTARPSGSLPDLAPRRPE